MLQGCAHSGRQWSGLGTTQEKIARTPLPPTNLPQTYEIKGYTVNSAPSTAPTNLNLGTSLMLVWLTILNRQLSGLAHY